ncbi:polyprotein [Falcovirus A1]|uniref:Genome polyprotein n=1 Tax=Falcovirus A1 TaxID=1641896 RepID=A0A0E3XT08_9PICO|nr:polyprotein [Falcovirus A1]AKC42744.1 polyprotein [harkavirus A1]
MAELNRTSVLVPETVSPAGGIVEDAARLAQRFNVRNVATLVGDVASSALGVSPVDSFGGLFGVQNLQQATANLADVFSAHATSFSDQAAEPVQVKSGPVVSSPENPSNLEVPLQIPTLSDRYYPIAEFSWKYASRYLHIWDPLISIPVPDILYQKDTKNKNPVFAVTGVLQYHRFLRTDFEILVQVNAPPFYQGALLIVYMPLEVDQVGFTTQSGHTSEDADSLTCKPGYIIRSPATLLNYPHGMINLYSNSSVRIQVPFTYFANSYDQIHFRHTQLGHIVVYDLTSLSTYTTASTIQIPVTVSLRMVNLQMTGLRPAFQLPTLSVREFERRVHYQGDTHSDKFIEILPGPGAQFLNGRFVTETSRRLALEDVDVRDDVSSFGYAPTQDLLEFVRIPSLIGIVKWQVSTNSREVLASFPVGPSYVGYQADINIRNAGKSDKSWKPLFSLDTNLSYLASQYASWRGGISYHIQVVMYAFHRGRQQVLYIPGSGEFTGSDATDHQNARYKVFDLGLETTFTFTVPYMDSRPFVSTQPYLGTANQSITPPDHFVQALHNTTGTLYLVAWTKLIAPVTTAQFVTLNVWVSGAADFQFFFPSLQGLLAPIPKEGKLQAGEIEATDEIPDMVQPDVVQKRDDTFFYSHTDMKTFLGRAHFYARFQLTSTVRSSSAHLIADTSGVLGAIFQAHTFWRGPVNLHLNKDSAASLLVAVVPPGVNTGTSVEELASVGAVGWPANSTTLDVRVPFYVNFTGLVTDPFYRFDETERIQTQAGTKKAVVSPLAPVSLGTLVILDLDTTSYRTQVTVFLSFDGQLATKRAVPCTKVMGPVDVTQYVTDDVGHFDIGVEVDHLPYIPIEDMKVQLQGDVLEEGSVVYDKDYGLVVSMGNRDKRLAVVTLKKGVVCEVTGDWRVVNECDGCATPYHPSDISDHANALLGCKLASSSLTAEGFVNMLRNGCFHVRSPLRRLFSPRISSQGKADSKTNGNVAEQGTSSAKSDEKPTCRSWLSDLWKLPSSVRSLSMDAEFFKRKLVNMSPSVFQGEESMVQRAMAFVIKVTSYTALILTASDKKAVLLSVFGMIGSDVMLFAPCACGWIVSRIERFVAKIGSMWPFSKKNNDDTVLSVVTQGSICEGVEGLAADIVSAMFGVESSPELIDFLRLCRIVTTVTATLKGVYWIFSTFLSAMRTAFEFFPRRNYSKKLEKYKEALVRMMAETNSYLMLPEDKWTDHREAIRSLYSKCLFFQVELADMEVESNIYVPLRATMANLDRLYNAVAIDDGVYTRVEPAVILLCGQPGTGKSILARNLAADLCVLAGLPPGTNVYSKPWTTADGFWDGYRGQYVQIIDDMGQDPDDEDFVGFLQVVSTAIYRCNMARLEAKGRLYQTPVIIVTTNFGTKFDSQAEITTVRSSSAVARRITVKAKVLADEDATPRDFIDPEMTKCKIMVGGKVTPYKTLLDTCHRKILDKLETFRDMIRARSDYQSAHLVPDPSVKELHLPAELADMPLFKGLQQKAKAEPKKHLSEKILDKLRAIIDKCIEGVRNWWAPAATLLVTLFGIAGLGYGIYQHFMNVGTEQQPVEQGVYQPAPTVRPPPKPMAPIPDFRIVHQGAEEVVQKVSSNVLNISAVGSVDGVVRTIRMNALAVGGDRFVFPAHLVESFTGTISMQLEHPLFKYSYDYNTETREGRVELGGSPCDMIIMHIPGLSYHFPDITKLVASGDTFPRMGMGNVGCLIVRNDGLTHALQARNFWHYGRMVLQGKVLSEYIIGYSTVTVVGHCGAPVLVRLPEGYRVIGIHVAGDGACRGFCVPLISEMLQGGIHQQGLPYVVNVGRLDQKVYIPTRTRYGPTVFQHYLTTNAAPSVKHPNDPRCEVDFIHAIFKKYDRPIAPMPMIKHHQSCVLEYMWSLLNRVCGPFHRVSFDSAVNGWSPYVKPLNLQSSAGWPYLKDYTNKQKCLEAGAAEEGVVELERRYRSGLDADIIFVSYLKDELRPLEKIKQGKTRLIEASPIHYVILFREVVCEFMWSFHARHGVELHSAVGCDPEVFWTVLFHSLKQHKHAFDIDYSKFDASVSVEFLQMVLWLLKKFTDPENASLLEWLWQPILRTKHVYMDEIYLVEGGVPSGMPCTTVVNTLVNMMIVVYVWSVTGHDVCDLDSQMTFCCYGDDLVLSTSDDDFTFEQFSRVAQDLGFEATNACKDGVVVDKVEDLTFLKRGFRCDEHFPFAIHPVIALQTVDNMLCWKSDTAVFQDNVDAAFGFLYHHGQDVFDRYQDLIRRVATDNGISIFLRPFSYYSRRWTGVMGFDLEGVHLEGAWNDVDLDVVIEDEDPIVASDYGHVQIHGLLSWFIDYNRFLAFGHDFPENQFWRVQYDGMGRFINCHGDIFTFNLTPQEQDVLRRFIVTESRRLYFLGFENRHFWPATENYFSFYFA